MVVLILSLHGKASPLALFLKGSWCSNACCYYRCNAYNRPTQSTFPSPWPQPRKQQCLIYLARFTAISNGFQEFGILGNSIFWDFEISGFRDFGTLGIWDSVQHLIRACFLEVTWPSTHQITRVQKWCCRIEPFLRTAARYT
jgi:hypothetical protein